MKKLKYLLFLMLIAVIAVGVLAGCSVDMSVDLEGKFKVIYCGNGGELNASPERIFMIGEGRKAFDPANGEPLSQAIRAGYKLAGWAKGELDENGNPVFAEAPITDDLDGGVYRNKFGAIRESLVYLDQTGTVKQYYYDYDRNSFWDFNKDVITEDTCLIAVWERYNKFIIAEKNDSGEWENYEDLLSNDFVIGSGAVYEKYEDRLYNVENNQGTRVTQENVEEAFKERVPNHTVLKYYKDAACTQEITFPYTISDKATVIYYKAIEGDFDLVSDAKTFSNSYAANKNIYLLGDLDFKDIFVNLSNVTYGGEIRGNGFSLNNIKTEVVQNVAPYGEKNSYGGFFGKLVNAQISDLTINMTTSFQIAVDPKNSNMGGSANDEVCYFGLVASLMDGCIFKDFDVNIEYQITRSEVEGEAYWVPDPTPGDPDNGYYEFPTIKNEFEVDVEVYDWAPETDGTNVNVFDDDCSISSECTLDER